MSTRATIIAKTETGYKSIYLHFDGYISHTGKILFEHYQDPEKVNRLIGLGDISQIGERVEPIGPHSYENPERGTTVAYIRDRGETGCEAREFKTAKEAEIKGTAYKYLFENGKWTVDGVDLKNAIEQEQE